MPWYEYTPMPGGDNRRLPLVEVLLWHGVRRVRILAVVDSGAEASLVDAGYADLLGLDRKDAVPHDAGTAGGGTLTCLRWPRAVIEIQFGRHRFPFWGMFAEFPAGTSADNLMGRSDFFQTYTVQFWEWAALMHIDRAPHMARPPARP